MRLLAIILSMAAPLSASAARLIAWYDFAASNDGAIVDKSGFGNHGTLQGPAHVAERGVLRCSGEGWVELPGGATLWGPAAHQGSVSLWVRTDFAPQDLPHGQWQGYSMIFYAMQTDGNGLPDGYDEIGIWCHGPKLHVKVSGGSAGPTFSLTSPLRAGVWSHIAVCWRPGYTALYIDGSRAAERTGRLEPPALDGFAAAIGRHPSSKRWPWRGDISDCRLYDDALTPQEISTLSAGRRISAAPADQYAPGHSPITRVDWGTVWLGRRTARLELKGPHHTQPLQAFCEVVDLTGRHTFRRVDVPARARTETASVELPYEVEQEGFNRVNLVVAQTADGRVIAGRSRFVNIPPLLPAIGAVERELTTAQNIVVSAPQDVADAVREALAPQTRRLSGELADLKAAAGHTEDATAWQRLREAASELRSRTAKLHTRAAIYAKGAKGGKLPEFGLGVDHGLRKYLKSDPFEGQLEATIRVNAARNEYEAVQIAVFGLDAPVEDATLHASDLQGPNGARIPAGNIRWNRVGYVQTEKPSYQVRHVGLWPDPLLPPAPFDAAPGSFALAWLTMYVPADAHPGEYAGHITIDPQNAGVRQLDIKLHVWGFALPERSSLTTAFGLNSIGRFRSNVDVDKYLANARMHRISLGFPGIVIQPATVQYPAFDLRGETLKFRVLCEAPEDAEIGPLFLVCETRDSTRSVYGPIELAADRWTSVALAMHEDEKPNRIRFEYRNCGPVRLTFSAVTAGDRTFDTMGNAEYWIVNGPWGSVERTENGLLFEIAAPEQPETLIEEWPGIERAAGPTPSQIDLDVDFAPFDARIDKYLHRGINCIPIPLPGCPRDITAAQAKQLVRENRLGPIARAYQQHLRHKGWLDYAYTYVADEPHPGDYPALNVVQGTIRQWAPDVRNMITARSFPEQLQYVDIWCPELYSFKPRQAAQQQDSGKTVWWYPAFSTRHPYPNFWIDYPAIDNRIIFWLTWKHNIDGLLYWSVSNWWRQDPWKSAMTFPGANGDGTLLYPAEDGSPVDSIRWECLRDGAEDYEYFVLLRDLLAGMPQAQPGASQHAADVAAKARRLVAIDDDIVKDWRQWTADPDALIARRNAMGDVIEKLMEVAP